jgi:hypothetical protein
MSRQPQRANGSASRVARPPEHFFAIADFRASRGGSASIDALFRGLAPIKSG